MPGAYKSSDEIKRKLREIKKFELKLRSDINLPNSNLSGNNFHINTHKTAKSDYNGRGLVWSKFFDLRDFPNGDVKYTLDKLSLMTKEEFTEVIEEYFYHLYYWYCKEKGISNDSFIDIDILTELGLPIDSGYDDVIRAFRERVKSYHPDNGGDVGKFLKIMESYNKFREDIRI